MERSSGCSRPSKQPLMVRTFLKVYMELGSYFLFLQVQIKDIIIITPFLKHFFESFPDLMPKPKDVVDAVGKRDDHKSTGPQETVSKADDRVEGFPHLRPMAVSKASRISVFAHSRCTGTMHSKQTR